MKTETIVNALHEYSAEVIFPFNDRAGETFTFKLKSRRHSGCSSADYDRVIL
jgi:hypothetical protein